MRFLYMKLGVAGIVGGVVMTTLDMYWQSIVALTIGVGALGMGIKWHIVSLKRRWAEAEDCE